MQIDPSRAEALIVYLHQHIPLCRAMQIGLGGVDEAGLTLTAPLSLNHNDKGGAFGGSLATLCTLSGWAAVSFLCRDAGLEVDMLISESHLNYRRQLTDPTLCATAKWPEDAQTFLAALKAGDPARTTVKATAGAPAGGEIAVEFSGRFYVWRRAAAEPPLNGEL